MKTFLYLTLFLSIPATGMSQDKTNADLISALIHGNVENAQSALTHGAQVNRIRENAPLHWAVVIIDENDAKAVVELLLAKEADPNVPDHQKNTPLHDAVRFNRPHLIRLLIAHGARLDITNNDGLTPIDIAAQKYGEDSEIYRLLVPSRIKGIPT